MKTKSILAAMALSCLALNGKAQNWSTIGNLVVPGQFFGSTNNAVIPFKTNNDVRMLIGDGSTVPSQGYIGMGNNLGTAFTPTARLHLHETITGFNFPMPFLRYTTNITGVTATDGYEMGIDPIGNAHLINYESARDISIHTNNGGSGTYVERMRIFAQDNLGRIGISDNLPAAFIPQDRVHIFESTASNAFTRYSNLTTGNTATDGFQVGSTSLGNAYMFNLEAQPMQLGVFATPASGATAGQSQDIFIDNNPAQIYPDGADGPNGLEGGHWVGLETI